MKILISGFEPFHGDSFNPSKELVQKLSSLKHPFELSSVILPVSYEDGFRVLLGVIEKTQPHVILGFGLAKRRATLSVERVAINWAEARRPDEFGLQPQGERIDEDGPDGLFSDLPVQGMIKASLEAGVPASISNTAGTFVCNHLMYKVLRYARKHHLSGGFIHLPMPCEREGKSDGKISMNDMVVGATAMFSEIDRARSHLNALGS